MTFCIITHVIHNQVGNNYFGYAPYIDEMNLWLKNVDKVIIVAPKSNFEITAIHNCYKHKSITFIEVPQFSFTSFSNSFKAILNIPFIFFQIVKAIYYSNHIHLRCPGNMGLLASIAQIFFPKKHKTAKYAGNWDPKSNQPLSYKIQKNILSNTFFTRNMQVLVYGEWKNQTRNIKSFFTATYSESEKEVVQPLELKEPIKFIFVGTLAAGKKPIYAVKIVEQLLKNNKNCQLEIYGNGAEKDNLLKYISEKKLQNSIFLKGNVDKQKMKSIYKQSHFLLLPSKSEGWPKVVAEAMFWGCFPIASNVSCISNMLDNQNRGLLLSLNIESDVENIEKIISNPILYSTKIKSAINWSRKFTIDKFEDEIKLLLH